MKLYYVPGACSLAPHIALQELGLPHSLVKVNGRTKESEEGDYVKINPKGSVPALRTDDGQLLTEVAVILQYLADRKPEAKLLPAIESGWDRYRAQEWLNYVATDIHKSLGLLFSAERFVPNAESRATYRETILKTLFGRLAWIDSQLATRETLLPSGFSVADIYLFTVLNWAKPLQVDLGEFRHLGRALEKTRGRASTQNALKAEGLL